MTLSDLERVLKDAEEFKKTSSYDLIKAAKAFPNHAEELFDRVLKDPEDFKRLITSSYDLVKIAKAFPNHAEEIFGRVLKDPEDFKRTFKDLNQLCEEAKIFPKHAEEIFGRVFKDPEDFKKIFTRGYELVEIAKAFPKHADELLDRVLKDPEEFKRIFTDDDLPYAARVFPNHADILGQESIEAAVKVIEAKAADIKEIKKNSRLMGVLRRRNDSLFSQIPEEIAQKIVADTRDSKQLNDKDTSDIIEQEYQNMPPII
jgi:hypothetical protein